MGKTIDIQKYNNRYIQINFKYLAFLVGLILLHLFCIPITGLAQTVSLVEALFVSLLLVQKKIFSAVLLFGAFMLTSYDSKFFFAEPVGVDEVYNVSFLPIISIYFFFLLTIIVFIISVRRVIKNKIKLNSLIAKFAVFTLVVSVPMGLITAVIGGSSIIAITRDIKTVTIPSLWTLSFFFLFFSSKRMTYRYEMLILHVLLAYVVVGIITSSMGFFLIRMERKNILYLPLASFFITSIILFANKMPRKTDKIFVLILFVFAVFFQLFFDSCINGKSWLVFVSVIIIELCLFVQRLTTNNNTVKISLVILIAISISVLSTKVVSFINDTENGKLLEFVSLFEGAQSGELDDVGDSAQFRFLEFITINDYYRNNPQFLLFGKGIGGGVPNAGYFAYSKTAFSDDQYKSNQFSVMHESLNMIYLKYGFMGLMFFIVVLVNGIKRIQYEPLFFVGCIWFFFYWAYSINLLFLGLPSFLIAYQKMNCRGGVCSDL